MYQFEFFVLPIISVLFSALIMSINTSLFKRCCLILLTVFVLGILGAFFHSSGKFEFTFNFLYRNELIELVLIYMVASVVVAITYHCVSQIKLFISIVSGSVTLLALPIYGVYIACYIGGC